MSECEINPCVKQEYESELTPSTTGFNLVERMTPQTIPNQNTIYSNGDDLFVWDGQKYVPLVGRGCNLPLDIQLYGTWTGQLDELVYVDQTIAETIDTGINIQDAPSDLIYFFVTIECDGEYSGNVDVSTENVWSGVSFGIFGRNHLNYGSTVFNVLTYTHAIRPQTKEDLNANLSSAVGIGFSSGQTVKFTRSVVSASFGFQRIMGGNYIVNVYALKLGNFQ